MDNAQALYGEIFPSLVPPTMRRADLLSPRSFQFRALRLGLRAHARKMGCRDLESRRLGDLEMEERGEIERLETGRFGDRGTLRSAD